MSTSSTRTARQTRTVIYCFTDDPNAVIDVAQVKLTDNHADRKGGGVYVHRGQFTLRAPVAFTGNTATGGWDGGAFLPPNATAILINLPTGSQTITAYS